MFITQIIVHNYYRRVVHSKMRIEWDCTCRMYFRASTCGGVM